MIMDSRLLDMGSVSRGYWLVAMGRKGRGLLIIDSRLLVMGRVGREYWLWVEKVEDY